MSHYPTHMKISELSAHSKTPLSTIRFYFREGMMPAPIKTSKSMAYYTKDHLDRLLKIQKMKKRNISLSAIKDVLLNESDQPSSSEEANGVRLTSTREEILKVAVRLFREKGYDRVTTSNIAVSAKISKSTLYQYFKDKEDLFCECLESIFYDVGKDIPEIQNETDGLKRLLARSRHFDRYYSNIINLMNLARYKADINPGKFKEKWERALQNFVDPIRKDFELIIQQNKISLKNSNLITALFLGAVEYGVYYQMTHHVKWEAIVDEFWRFFIGFCKIRDRKIVL